MIPKITQEAPNIVQRYWCSTCGRSLPAPDQHDDQWRFCPRCGEPIEYEKAAKARARKQSQPPRKPRDDNSGDVVRSMFEAMGEELLRNAR